MGNGLEHLAAWRGRDPLTIPQAASLIVGVRPSAPFMTEKRTATERTGVELQVFDWYERIVLDAKSGQLRFDLKTGPAGKPTTLINERDGTIVHAYSGRGARHVPKYELSTVFVEDLRTWLESIGHRPAFFFPESTDKGSTEPPPERGHANESDELRWAILASSKWWKDADRDDKTTHHTNKTVSDWLREKNPNLDHTAADRIATLVRPSWAAKGRRSDK